jgi:ribosomal protein L18
MGRPKKYTSDAEKARAYRIRKKLKESEHPPELDQVARLLHRLYKKRAEEGIGDAAEMVGKTAYETLLKVVVYELLFDRHIERDGTFERPPLDKLIRPAHGSEPGLPSWIISPNGLSEEVGSYISYDQELVDDEDEEEEKEEVAA